MNQILITKDNYADFISVLPEKLPGPYRTTIGAYDEDGYICGAISMQRNAEEYNLDWIYVVPSKRRQRIGSQLLERLNDMVKHIDGYVIRAEFEAGDSDSLYQFFLSDALEELYIDLDYLHDRYYIQPAELLALTENKLPKVRAKSLPFFELSQREQRVVLDQISDQYEIDDYTAWQAACEKELCHVIYTGEELAALIFITRRTDGNLELSYLYGPDPGKLAALLGYVCSEVLRLYPEAGMIFDAVNENSTALAGKLFPEAYTIPIYEAEM